VQEKMKHTNAFSFLLFYLILNINKKRKEPRFERKLEVLMPAISCLTSCWPTLFSFYYLVGRYEQLVFKQLPVAGICFLEHKRSIPFLFSFIILAQSLMKEN